MRLPFFNRSSTEPLQVTLQQMSQNGMAVYCKLPPEAVPGEGELKSVSRAWIERHAEDPLRSALIGYVEAGLTKWQIARFQEVPPPPPGIVAYSRVGEIGERRFADATHALVVSAFDIAGNPRVGLFAITACARAAAEHFSGIIFDPGTLFLEPMSKYSTPPPADGRVVIAQHIKVVHSADQRGVGWVTTRGMGKFGLPNLDVADIPASLCDKASEVLTGVARLIILRAHEATQGAKEWPVTMAMPETLCVTALDIVRGHGKEDEMTGDLAGRAASVALAWHKPRPDSETFLRIGPPPGFRGEAATWWYGVLSDLFGSEDSLYVTSSKNEFMEEAHLRAVSEMPAIKTRFHRGLEPGEMLFIKRGFPVTGGPEEFMWVVVGTWQGDRINGTLSNDSRFRLDLRAGHAVEFPEAEAFDWMIYRSDGGMEGGYTSAVACREGQQLDD